MKAHKVVLLASVCSASVTALGLSLWHGTNGAAAVQGIDPIQSSSIPSNIIERRNVSPPAVFSVSNFDRRTVCLVERGAALTSRSRDVHAPPDCEAVMAGLTGIRTWIDNEDGTVTLVDGQGAVVLSLTRGRSFTYEAVDATAGDIALLMVP
ncbi:hypothetical protein FE840_000490 [Peteryoungia desertarenae]|uniref:Alkaline proteinase inhibitor/ Outer membrane lipoprotein Omp19 domain-containing protein n=1 Tax=Peteryoungia desertarenae TaxID=1813451 RepID=A0ABX6QHW2_9HYPH|nr:hypothetical protein [Peteryoungia desertarenae]QLF68158.1 hypothetical protein FE840_000490 [Peteryoungia desertarenae]